jgi:transcriptional regulator with XRE-family HTH domain
VEAGYGAMIREMRLAAGLTQRELAAKIGCTDGFLAFAELERRAPSPEFMHRLLDALDAPKADRERVLGALMAARQQHREAREQARYAALTKSPMPATGAEIATSADPGVAEPTEAEYEQALRDLQTAYADPEARPGLLATLRAFALSARASSERDRP